MDKSGGIENITGVEGYEDDEFGMGSAERFQLTFLKFSVDISIHR
jgi:hypothetical protein